MLDSRKSQYKLASVEEKKKKIILSHFISYTELNESYKRNHRLKEAVICRKICFHCF